MEEELKNAEATASENAQSDESSEEELLIEPQQEEETADSLRAKLAKAEAERDNYKKGMLAAKSKAKSENKAEPDVEQIATAAATQVIEKRNERDAISQFTTKYPALKDPKKWQEVIVNYQPRSGKLSVSDVEKDLEAALVLAKHYGGGKIGGEEIALNDYAAVSRAGSAADREPSSGIKDSTIEMGKRFRHTAEQLAKEDDSPFAEVL